MERKTKHRILGIIVMAALVIALLPLFHGSSNDIKADPQATMLPPFPDQSTQISDNTTPEFKAALANQTSPIPFKNSQDDSAFNQLPDDTINPNSSKAYNEYNKSEKATTEQPIKKPLVKQPHVEDDNDIEAPIASNNDHDEVSAERAEKTPQTTESIFRNSLESELQDAASPAVKKTSRSAENRKSATNKIKQAQRKKHLPLDVDGLFKLKSSAWVIQLGSYKNKSTALRLVNRLRANGYNAFIQQASAGTSVFVGPEAKQDIARSIAARLEYEMKIQGYVVSYKPLTL